LGQFLAQILLGFVFRKREDALLVRLYFNVVLISNQKNLKKIAFFFHFFTHFDK